MNQIQIFIYLSSELNSQESATHAARIQNTVALSMLEETTT
jgi:hypothetical protein